MKDRHDYLKILYGLSDDQLCPRDRLRSVGPSVSMLGQMYCCIDENIQESPYF